MSLKKEGRVPPGNKDSPQRKGSPHNGKSPSSRDCGRLPEHTPRGRAGIQDPALDFLSETFDPVKVLRCSLDEVCLPQPCIQACDNLHAYDSVLRGTKTSVLASKKKSLNEMGAANKECAGRKLPIKKKFKTVLDFMERRSVTGPFSTLQRSWATGQRVQVLMRHCSGMRGVCEGTLVAFDHHMNLVLCNVTEWCTPFRTVANGGITLSKNQRRRRRKMELAGGGEPARDKQAADEETNITEEIVVEGRRKEETLEDGGKRKNGRRWEKCQSVKQLFIRGDNVILVSSAS